MRTKTDRNPNRRSNNGTGEINPPKRQSCNQCNNLSTYDGPETLKAVAVAKKAAKAVAVQNFMVIGTASVGN